MEPVWALLDAGSHGPILKTLKRSYRPLANPVRGFETVRAPHRQSRLVTVGLRTGVSKTIRHPHGLMRQPHGSVVSASAPYETRKIHVRVVAIPWPKHTENP